MTDLRIPYGSKEYLHIPFPAPANAATYDVEISVVTYPDHADEDEWHEAGWTPDASPPAARILIGPGTDIPLPVGSYIARARISATPEEPIVESGIVQIH